MSWTLFDDCPVPTTVYVQPAGRDRYRWRVYVPGGTGPDGVALGRILVGTGHGRQNEIKAAAWRAYRRARDLLVWRSRPFDGEVEARLHELDLVATVCNFTTRSTWEVRVDGEIIAQGEVASTMSAYVDSQTLAVEATKKRRQTQAQDECARIVRGLLP